MEPPSPESPRLPRRNFLGCLAAAAFPSAAQTASGGRDVVYAVAHMHDDCMGWLAPFHVERNYALYSYLDHQDLAARDPNYHYVMSEVPNFITMMECEPRRFEELGRLIREGRVEAVNAFVCEATVNLCGGEALVMQAVEGLRWYRQVMNLRPRHAYCIDVVGWHEQMAQIVSGLELDSFLYCRYNPTVDTPRDGEMIAGGAPLHWIESPDGTRALALNPGHYAGMFSKAMRPEKPLAREQLLAVLNKDVAAVKTRWARNPGAPMLTLATPSDYGLTFHYKGYPRELLEVWEASHPDTGIRFSTLNEWLARAKPGIEQGKYGLPTVRTGSKIYAGADEWAWGSFWVMAPRAKQWFRRSEHLCQSSEALAAVASIETGMPYPVQDYLHVWFLMALNVDRGPLWGIAVSGVYEHPKGWDMRDRFEMADRIARDTTARSLSALLGKGNDTIGLFNSTNWERHDPVELRLPERKSPKDIPFQLLEDGVTTLVETRLPAMGVRTFSLAAGTPPEAAGAELPPVIETRYYSAKIDHRSGALLSLKLKPSGREVLGGPVNVVQAQVNHPDYVPKDNPEGFDDWDAHNLYRRDKRKVIASTGEGPCAMVVRTGPLATIVEIQSILAGAELRRVVRFYRESPRIDFVTVTRDVPHATAIVADFPLAGDVVELRRGIPYGFSHGWWAERTPGQRGNHVGIVPVIRWSDYTLDAGGGVALLDRGVPGRELFGRTATILLHYGINSYYADTHTNWMSGRDPQVFQYALLAHEAPWETARIPELAWEYNAPPLVVNDVSLAKSRSYVETSGNVIVEALRRVEGEIEIRMVESRGLAGTATVRIMLPHQDAALTNLVGRGRTALTPHAAGPGSEEYRFPIRPQQIVTLRLKTRDAVPVPAALRTFEPLIPESKRLFTRGFRHPEYKGYPPRTVQDAVKWRSLE